MPISPDDPQISETFNRTDATFINDEPPSSLRPAEPLAQRRPAQQLVTYLRKFSAAIRTRRPTSAEHQSTGSNGVLQDKVTAPAPVAGSAGHHVTTPSTSPETARRQVVPLTSFEHASPTQATSATNRTSRFSIANGLRVMSLPRQAARDERAAVLFAKYGLESSAGVQTTALPAVTPAEETAPLLRVEKKPRVRMHTTCHECSTVFSAAKATRCKKCGHQRCMKCFRAAPKGVRDLVAQTTQTIQTIQTTPTPTAPLSGRASPSRRKRSKSPSINGSIVSSRTQRTSSASPRPSRRSTSGSSRHRARSSSSNFVSLRLVPSPHSQLSATSLLLPDTYQSSDEETPTMEDYLKLCTFVPTRKRGHSNADDQSCSLSCARSRVYKDREGTPPCGRMSGEGNGAPRAAHGPRERVHRKVRQRKRRVCVACDSAHSGRGDLCAGCGGLKGTL